MNRRSFLGAAGGTAIATGLGATAAAAAAPRREPDGSVSSQLFLKPDGLAPAQFDRLPLEWHKGRVKALQGKLRELGLAGAVLTDRWNIIYFAGLWHSTTERLFNAFIPAEGAGDPIWFYPSLDRDLVKTWWMGDGDMYFDWHHGEGAFPHEGKVQMGAKVDLFDWMLKGLKRRGYGGKRLGIDRDLSAGTQRAVEGVIGNEMTPVGDACVGFRMRKTSEELSLWRRAYEVFNKVHAYARDLLIERGTDITDFDVASAATKWGTDLILKDILRDGAPHTAVGISLNVSCRAGRGTAYPHPNQFHHNRIVRGQALQIAGGIRIGGCGGELYRAFLLAPFTDHMKKVWEVSRDCCAIQKEESVSGVTCSTVAYKVHRYQVKNGMQKYIYHRPAHGEGTEGHQPPYLALGDHTMLEPGMVFSVEPGLYDPENGFGVNWSDDFVVQTEGPALQMSRLPWTEEWCHLTL